MVLYYQEQLLRHQLYLRSEHYPDDSCYKYVGFSYGLAKQLQVNNFNRSDLKQQQQNLLSSTTTEATTGCGRVYYNRISNDYESA